MTEILIGTSGYYYEDWAGVFYPQSLSKKGYLKYYSSRFPFCELNFSYYQMPLRSRMIALATEVPDSFQFAVKAYKGLTHERGPNSMEQADEFFHALTPLKEEGRLSAVLIQFPYSFHYNQTNRKYLAALIDKLDGLPLAVEFRNREWMLERVYSGLMERGVCFVLTDMPDLDNLPLPTSKVTSETGYIRFHGRNKENWWKGDNTSRYDYLYCERELNLWICRIEEIAPKVKRLLIAFNNHHKGKAVKNAFEMYNLLKKTSGSLSISKISINF